MGNRKNKRRSTVQVRGIAKSRKLTRIQTNKKPELSDDILEVDNRPSPKEKPDFEDGINTEPTAGISLGSSDDCIATSNSASEAKIKMDYSKSSENSNVNNVYILIDSSILCSLLDSLAKCDVCDKLLETKVNFDSAKGFCYEIKGNCKNCSHETVLCKTSKVYI